MLVISFREFREKQGFFLDKVKKGEEIILRARDGFSARLQPITNDDTLMSKEEFLAKIERSKQQANEGKVKTFTSKEELNAYFEAL